MSDNAIKCIHYRQDRVATQSSLLVDENEKPFRLSWFPKIYTKPLPRVNDIWSARVVARDPGGRGLIVNLADKVQAYLQVKKKAPNDGELIVVQIKSEARDEKLAVCVPTHLPKKSVQPESLGLIASNPDIEFQKNVEVLETVDLDVADTRIDEAIEAALLDSHSIPGGGSFHIEKTRACTAVDVDAGGRFSKGSSEAFVTQINQDAVPEIARLLSLKNAGGLVVLDLMKMNRNEAKNDVIAAFQSSLGRFLGRATEFGKFSLFGLLEIKIAHKGEGIESLYSKLSDLDKIALMMLSELEVQAMHFRGDRFNVRVSQDMRHYLDALEYDWFEAMLNRIGGRFFLVDDERLKGPSYSMEKI